MKYTWIILLGISCAFWGCNKNGTERSEDQAEELRQNSGEQKENLGDKIDEAAKDVGDAAKDAGRAVGDAAKDAAGAVKEAFDPMMPGKAAIHVVTLDRVKFTESDFHRSVVRAPIDIKVEILENGIPVEPSMGRAVIDGKRGERTLTDPVQWTVNFDPNKTYQLRIAETSIVSDKVSWELPGEPHKGHWIIGGSKGTVRLGDNSYVHFTDRVAR